MKTKKLIKNFCLFIFLFLNSTSLFALDETRINFGTGFFINSQGYLLTAYHVIRGKDVIWVKTSKEQLWAQAEMIKSDPMLDLALVRISKNTPYLKMADWESVPIGLEIYSIGFPMLGFQSNSIKITQGLINSDEGINRQKKLFQISAEIEKGNSGGPIISPDGLVVGVTLSKLNALSVAEKTNDLPQNVNFALKTKMVMKFLEDTDLNIKSSNISTSSFSRPFEILKNSESSIAIIIAMDKETAEKNKNFLAH